MNTHDKELETAVSIAKEAGVIMLQYFDDDQQVEVKEDNSRVTIADKLINSLVIDRLSKTFPEDGVIGEEESNTEYGGGRKWFCDPIDGTAAYTYGVPTAMFSLALVVDGKPVIGVAYDPFLDRMYTAKAGEKSHCNGKALSVSDLDIKSGVCAVSGGVGSLPKTKYFQRMLDDRIWMTSFSGAVYKCCLVARGKLMSFVEISLNAHDVAAAHVIVEGAGGKITAVDGSELDYTKPFKGAIVTNKVTHQQMVDYCS